VAGLTVLDASVIVGYFDAGDAHHEDARAIVAGAEALRASVLTVGEASVEAVRAGRLDELLAAFARIQLGTVGVGAEDAPSLARLRALTGLKMPDCCVLHAAITVGADAIGTRDRKLAKAAREHGMETP
jgi:predicted nucleic acid-binding protein